MNKLPPVSSLSVYAFTRFPLGAPFVFEVFSRIPGIQAASSPVVLYWITYPKADNL